MAQVPTECTGLLARGVKIPANADASTSGACYQRYLRGWAAFRHIPVMRDLPVSLCTGSRREPGADRRRTSPGPRHTGVAKGLTPGRATCSGEPIAWNVLRIETAKRVGR